MPKYTLIPCLLVAILSSSSTPRADEEHVQHITLKTGNIMSRLLIPSDYIGNEIQPINEYDMLTIKALLPDYKAAADYTPYAKNSIQEDRNLKIRDSDNYIQIQLFQGTKNGIEQSIKKIEERLIRKKYDESERIGLFSYYDNTSDKSGVMRNNMLFISIDTNNPYRVIIECPTAYKSNNSHIYCYARTSFFGLMYGSYLFSYAHFREWKRIDTGVRLLISSFKE